MSLVRLLVLLIACCLVAQPAFARALSACTHGAGDAAATLDEHAHHDDHGEVPDTDGSCDCGCACADLACAHGGGALALPVALVASAPVQVTLPPFPRTAAGCAQSAPDTPLRPPNPA